MTWACWLLLCFTPAVWVVSSPWVPVWLKVVIVGACLAVTALVFEGHGHEQAKKGRTPW